MNDEGVCRTAPATPGLFNRSLDQFLCQIKTLTQQKLYCFSRLQIRDDGQSYNCKIYLFLIIVLFFFIIVIFWHTNQVKTTVIHENPYITHEKNLFSVDPNVNNRTSLKCLSYYQTKITLICFLFGFKYLCSLHLTDVTLGQCLSRALTVSRPRSGEEPQLTNSSRSDSLPGQDQSDLQGLQP